LVHSGLDGPSSYDTTGVGPENAAAGLALVEPRPDLVVVGHSHCELRDSVINGVHFVQPPSHARGLSIVYVTMVKAGRRDGGSGTRGPGYRVAAIRADLVPLAFEAEQPRLVRRVAAAHDRVRVWGTTPLGTAGAGFGGRDGRVEDTPLLDFINEVQRRHAGADLSATTLFDPGAGFPEGEIRLRDVAGVYPYENTLRAVRISGAQLEAFLEHSARYYRTYAPGGAIVNDSVWGYNFDAVSGVDYTLDLTRPVGARVRLAYRGQPVQPTDSFTLALNSYRQEGGGGYAMLRCARVVFDRQESVRDLLAAEVQRAGRLEAARYFQRNWSLEPPAARAAAVPPPAPVSDGDSTLLRVLAIADLHGALEPRVWGWSRGRPVGGVAALRSWLDSLARACGCATVRLDAGDQWQGTLVSSRDYGRTAVAALNLLRLDAAAIGNHEFDWSVDTLRARMGEARYRFVSANILDSTGTARPAWAEPWTLVERGGQRVAVIGVTARGTATSTSPRHVRGLTFADGAASVRRVLPQARAASDFVVVVAHAGALCDS
ncbi:MAG: 5'-nucleotidase C-terminal domain-containing protein, partial [Acidimicrobiales bacterium]